MPADWSDEDEDLRTPEIVALLGGIKRTSKKHDGHVTDRQGEAPRPSDTTIDMEPAPKKLTLAEKLAFGLPNFATAAMYLPTSIHINKFFADTLLVPPSHLAIATAIARGFDTLLDPFFGWLSDNTKTRWGRRKPYIAFGAPLNALFYFLLFTPPASLSPESAGVWFGVFFALYLMVPMNLPHHALGPELTLDYNERSSLYAYSESFSLLGVILAAAAPGILAQFMTDTRLIFFIMAATVAVLLVLTFAVLLYVIKEPDQAVHDGNPLVPGLRRAWRNSPFRVLVLTSVIGSVANHAVALMFPFWISYVLHPQNDSLWLAACLLTYFGCSAVSIPMWCYLATHFDKKSVWLVGWAVQMPTSLLMWFLSEGATFTLIALVAVLGLSFGGSSYLYKAIQADAIDYDELRTTRRREGQYITFWALIPKLVAIPAASIPLLILDHAGYVANQHPQPHEVVTTIKFMTTIMPFLLSAMALSVASTYPINKATNERITEMIQRRRRAIYNNQPMPEEIDPITGRALPTTSGGISTLSSDFCWYLDYFSEDELRALLRGGQKALIWSVMMSIYATLAVLVFAIFLIIFGSITIKVVGVMGVSFCMAILVFHFLRLHAARQFNQEKIHAFRKGKDEYFRVMIPESAPVDR